MEKSESCITTTQHRCSDDMAAGKGLTDACAHYSNYIIHNQKINSEWFQI